MRQDPRYFYYKRCCLEDRTLRFYYGVLLKRAAKNKTVLLTLIGFINELEVRNMKFRYPSY